MSGAQKYFPGYKAGKGSILQTATHTTDHFLHENPKKSSTALPTHGCPSLVFYQNQRLAKSQYFTCAKKKPLERDAVSVVFSHSPLAQAQP